MIPYGTSKFDAWCDAHWKWVVGLCLAGIVAFAAGYAAHRHTERIVTVTEYKDRVVEHTVTVEKPVIQYRDRVITRTVTKPDGTKVETHVDEHAGKETGGTTTTTDRDETRTGHVETVAAPEGRWSVRVLAGANTLGGVVAGAGAEYRLVGPLTVGAWATGPVAGAQTGFTVGVSAGLRLP